MSFDDALANGHPQPRTCSLRGIKRLKQLLLLLEIETRTIIGNLDFHFVPFAANIDFNPHRIVTSGERVFE